MGNAVKNIAQANVITYRDSGSKFYTGGCNKFVSCDAIPVRRETISIMRQVGAQGKGWIELGQVVPDNYPNSVLCQVLKLPNESLMWVQATDYDANFSTQCNSCCTPATCTTPTGLTASNIAQTTATVSFGAINDVSGYEWVVNTSSSQPTGDGTFSSTNTVNITGLTNNTLYHFWVRTICGPGSISSWTSVTFTTLQ